MNEQLKKAVVDLVKQERLTSENFKKLEQIIKNCKELVNVIDQTNSRKPSLLHIAIEKQHEEVINLLLEHGANLISFNINHDTPLHYAARSTLPSRVIVKLFTKALFSSIKPEDLINHGGQTPFHIAAEYGKCDIIYHVLDEITPRPQALAQLLIKADEKGWNLQHALVAGKYYDECLMLKLAEIGLSIDSRSQGRLQTPLHLAIVYNKLPAIKALLQAHADLTARDKDELTIYQYYLLFILFDPKHNDNFVIELLQLLIAANVNFSTKVKVQLGFGKHDVDCAALHIAALRHRLEVVKLLLHHQADPDQPSSEGKKPYEYVENLNQIELYNLLKSHTKIENSDEKDIEVHLRKDSILPGTVKSSTADPITTCQLVLQRYDRANDNDEDLSPLAVNEAIDEEAEQMWEQDQAQDNSHSMIQRIQTDLQHLEPQQYDLAVQVGRQMQSLRAEVNYQRQQLASIMGAYQEKQKVLQEKLKVRQDRLLAYFSSVYCRQLNLMAVGVLAMKSGLLTTDSGKIGYGARLIEIATSSFPFVGAGGMLIADAAGKFNEIHLKEKFEPFFEVCASLTEFEKHTLRSGIQLALSYEWQIKELADLANIKKFAKYCAGCALGYILDGHVSARRKTVGGLIKSEPLYEHLTYAVSFAELERRPEKAIIKEIQKEMQKLAGQSPCVGKLLTIGQDRQWTCEGLSLFTAVRSADGRLFIIPGRSDISKYRWRNGSEIVAQRLHMQIYQAIESADVISVHLSSSGSSIATDIEPLSLKPIHSPGSSHINSEQEDKILHLNKHIRKLEHELHKEQRYRANFAQLFHQLICELEKPSQQRAETFQAMREQLEKMNMSSPTSQRSSNVPLIRAVSPQRAWAAPNDSLSNQALLTQHLNSERQQQLLVPSQSNVNNSNAKNDESDKGKSPKTSRRASSSSS